MCAFDEADYETKSNRASDSLLDRIFGRLYVNKIVFALANNLNLIVGV